ncbi:hypothetical protein AY600_17935 [Phormidium willei BDU 130791]|nr:hypothetical protein AY600_17935 [Phormidium willei BDU 130791]
MVDSKRRPSIKQGFFPYLGIVSSIISTVFAISAGLISLYLTGVFEKSPNSYTISDAVYYVQSFIIFIVIIVVGERITDGIGMYERINRLKYIEDLIRSKSTLYFVGYRDEALDYASERFARAEQVLNTHIVSTTQARALEVSYSARSWDAAERAVMQFVENGGRYKDIVSKSRLDRETKLIKWALSNKDERGAFFKITSNEGPFINFMIIDYNSGKFANKSEVLFGWWLGQHSDSIPVYGSMEPDVVKTFRRYFDELWNVAGPESREDDFPSLG